MSQATKRKHVVREVLGEHVVPSDQQQIVKVSGLGLHVGELGAGQCVLALTDDTLKSWSFPEQVLRTPGNNLHEVETAEGQRFLVSMPSKYRKNIWIKRG